MEHDIRTRPITDFDPALQTLYCEFLRRSADTGLLWKEWEGSASLIRKRPTKTIMKAFPGDDRYPSMRDLGPGVAIGYSTLLRIEQASLCGLQFYPEKKYILGQPFFLFHHFQLP